MIRDVLSELASGTMTLDEVYELYDTIMYSNSTTPEAGLGLSHPEWSAHCHGVGFDELNRTISSSSRWLVRRSRRVARARRRPRVGEFSPE